MKGWKLHGAPHREGPERFDGGSTDIGQLPPRENGAGSTEPNGQSFPQLLVRPLDQIRNCR